MVHIVILDDRETNRKIFSKLAASIEPGVTVHSFGNPVELLAWLENNTPDLVVTDFKMPSMDVRNLSAACARCRIAARSRSSLSRFTRSENSACARLKRERPTSLPVDHQEFVTRARNLLKLRKQQIQLAARAENLAQELKDSERSREEALRVERAAGASHRYGSGHD